MKREIPSIMMWLICIFIIMAPASVSRGQSEDPFSTQQGSRLGGQRHNDKVFNVSKAGKDKGKLMEVFEAISKIEIKKQKPPIWHFETSQKIDNLNYLVRNSDTLYWLKLKNSQDWADGKIIEVYAKESERTKEYTTVLGANKTVTVIEEVEVPEPKIMSQEDFVRRLKAGETWKLRDFHKEKCQTCVGGQLGSLRGGGNCNVCSEGWVTNDLFVTW